MLFTITLFQRKLSFNFEILRHKHNYKIKFETIRGNLSKHPKILTSNMFINTFPGQPWLVANKPHFSLILKKTTNG